MCGGTCMAYLAIFIFFIFFVLIVIFFVLFWVSGHDGEVAEREGAVSVGVADEGAVCGQPLAEVVQAGTFCRSLFDEFHGDGGDDAGVYTVLPSVLVLVGTVAAVGVEDDAGLSSVLGISSLWVDVVDELVPVWAWDDVAWVADPVFSWWQRVVRHRVGGSLGMALTLARVGWGTIVVRWLGWVCRRSGGSVRCHASAGSAWLGRLAIRVMSNGWSAVWAHSWQSRIS